MCKSDLPSGQGGITVLVVEDDVDARDTLQESIAMLGHRAIGAANAAEALACFERYALDMALIDIGLPTVDGLQIARQIRAHLPPLPIRLVALTGFSDSMTRDAASSAGFDEFVVKPVMPDRLEALLQSSRC